jgi:SAM-dependent MidA family methyltransferase
VSEPASIAEVVAAEGGEVTFARFMELALTHPTLGYYSRAERLLRHGGDFNTAPGLSPFFNKTLARLVTEVADASLTTLPDGAGGPAAVVELGGGEGQLAAAVLAFWNEERPEFRERIAYRVVEVGAGLRQKQEQAAAPWAAGGWDVGWGRDLAEACAGVRPVVIVGNEFLDALPVHLVRVAGGSLSEAYVKVTPRSPEGAGRGPLGTGHLGIEQIWGPLTDETEAEIESLFGPLDVQLLRALSDDGFLEVFPALGGLMEQVATVMPSGSLVNVDYGEWFPGIAHCGQPWGLEGRRLRRRTVRGYFKHQMIADPLVRPGSQDLTADVDFAALDLRGRERGFETVLFTTLTAFLRGGGAQAELEALRALLPRGGPGDEPPAGGAPATGEAADVLEADRQATVLANLLDATDLGGAFKLMVQVRE